MDKDIQPGGQNLRGHLPPPFYSAKDEMPRSEYVPEGRVLSVSDPGNYGVGGYYGNTYKHEVYDLERNRLQQNAAEGQRDSYRQLGDRRWLNDPESEWRQEQASRYGYRSMEERMAEPDHRGKGPRSYRRPDEAILDDLNERLSDDPWLNATNIETSVNNGEVILSGTVEDRQSKRRAEDIAETVRGVKNIENRLRISSTD